MCPRTCLCSCSKVKPALLVPSRLEFWAADQGRTRAPPSALLGHRITPPLLELSLAHTRLRTRAFFFFFFTTPSRSSAEPTAAQFRFRPFPAQHSTPARKGLVFSLCVPSSVPGSVCFGFWEVMRVLGSRPLKSSAEQPCGVLCTVCFPSWVAGWSVLVS